jgi:trimeric autotransporter adhesin
MAAGKKSGRKSQASNDFLEPLAPINVAGTDVGTSRAFNNGAVSVAFELPALSPAATSYTVTASTSQTATGSSSPIIVTGFSTGATPTFTVTATNAAGTSLSSSASSSVTVTTVPATPSAPSVSTAALADTVSWTAPSTGGKTISGYTWASSDSKTGTVDGSTLSVVVTQEGNTSQTYTVYATNANGNSSASNASSSVTTPPFFPPFFPFFPPFFPFFPGFGPFFPPFFPFFPPFFIYSSKRFKHSILKVLNIKSK